MRKTLIAAILAFATLATVAGCGSQPPSDTAKIQQETQAAIQQANSTPVGSKFTLYQGSKYDPDRKALCDHLRDIPGVVKASSADGVITLVLKPGFPKGDVKPTAVRIEQYMMRNYRGDKSYLLKSVDLDYNIQDNPKAAQINQTYGNAGGDPTGSEAASVATGANSSDTVNDDTWHIFIAGKQID